MEEKKSSFGVPAAIIIAGLLIAFAIYAGGKQAPTPKTETTKLPDQSSEIQPVTSEDHIYGNPDAPIKIVEFSDPECPFCKRFHETIKQIMDEYGKGGKIAWVYRHFWKEMKRPDGTIYHSRSRKEIEATECAAEIGGNTKFWEYIGKLYEITPGNDGLDPAELPKIAVAVGLDKAKFEACLIENKYGTKIEAQYQDGLKAGARGTPFTVIVTSKNGNIPITQGALPYSDMKEIIETVLKSEQ